MYVRERESGRRGGGGRERGGGGSEGEGEREGGGREGGGKLKLRLIYDARRPLAHYNFRKKGKGGLYTYTVS